MDRYLSIGTLAEMTETSESYWRKAIARRLLPAVKIACGRALRRSFFASTSSEATDGGWGREAKPRDARWTGRGQGEGHAK